MKKRIIAALIAVVTLLSFTSCGNEKELNEAAEKAIKTSDYSFLCGTWRCTNFFTDAGYITIDE